MYILEMEPQRLQRRYTSIGKLNTLLSELFGKGTFSVEVSNISHDCVEASPRWSFFQSLKLVLLIFVKIENDSILLRAPRKLSQVMTLSKLLRSPVLTR